MKATGQIQSDGTDLQAAECPPGKQPTGGGFSAANTRGTVYASEPVGNLWAVYITGGMPGTQFTVSAICAS